MGRRRIYCLKHRAWHSLHAAAHCAGWECKKKNCHLKRAGK